MIHRLLVIALSLVALGGPALGVWLVIAMRRRSVNLRRRRETERVIPEIASAVVDYAAGSEDRARIQQFAQSHGETLENCLFQYHATMSGEGRGRIHDLVLELGLVARWCKEAGSRHPEKRRAAISRLGMVAAHEPSRRQSGDILRNALQDADQSTRLEAARTIIHAGAREEIAEILHAAVSHSLMVRIVLAEELRRHVLPLSQQVIPRILEERDTEKVAGALDMLAAWERAVPLPEIASLAIHSDRQVRLRALRVLPLIPGGPETTHAIQEALSSEDEEICIAAANAAGRMRLESAMGLLAGCLRRGQVDLARAAATALAALPPRGWETLAELSDYAGPITASAALEALERARKSAAGV